MSHKVLCKDRFGYEIFLHKKEFECFKYRNPVVGDHVTIHSALCEWDGVNGLVTGISATPDDDLPIMVQRANYDVWPFAVRELELHSLDDEVYEGGWIDPRIVPQSR